VDIVHVKIPDSHESLPAVGGHAHCRVRARYSKTLAEKLGYSRGAKLLIVHADDLGVTHSVNAASTKALETRLVNSASMMVPCPCFPEIADSIRSVGSFYEMCVIV
jgi:hypothetical protein